MQESYLHKLLINKLFYSNSTNLDSFLDLTYRLDLAGLMYHLFARRLGKKVITPHLNRIP